jgi:hypothetical protein
MAVQTSGSVTIEIGVVGDLKRIVLNGTVGDQIQVGFRAKDGDKEVQVGTFTSIIGSVATALGAGPKFKADFEDKLTKLAAIGPLAPVVNQLQNAALYVTDLYLSANYMEESQGAAKKFIVQNAAFGFRVEFSELELGPVKIVGFGVLFEYTVDKSVPAGGVGKLTTRPQH